MRTWSKMLFMLIVLSCLSVGYGLQTVSIDVDRQPIYFAKQQPVIDSKNRVLVPVRELGRFLGYSVHYQHAEKQMVLQKGSNKVVMTLYQSAYTVNGKQKKMDTMPVLQNGHAYVPLRVVAEAFGYHVQYAEKERRVYITTKLTYPSPSLPPIIPPTNPIPPETPSPPPIEQPPAINQELVQLPSEIDSKGCYIVRTVGELQAMKEDVDGCYHFKTRTPRCLHGG